MIKPFLTMFGVLFAMFVAVSIHYLSFDKSSIDGKLSKITSITHMAMPSLSVSYYEPKGVLGKSKNILYPEMMPIDRMDFIYAK